MAQPDRSQVRQRQPDAAPSGTPRLDRPLLVYTPLRIEQLAVAPGLPGARVLRCGMGPGRARRAACAAGGAGGPVAVAGLCGAVVPGVRPGDVVVASEVRGPHGVVACESRELAECLAGRGLGRVHVGPLACGARPVYGRRRAALARQGVIAADMESAWLAPAAGRPFAVLRVVLDTPERELYRPLATLRGAVRAWLALRRAAPALAQWAQRVGGRAPASPAAPVGERGHPAG